MDYPIIPYEIINEIGDILEDSRPLYLTCRRLYANSPDRTYWESRDEDRIRTHLVKIPTEIPLKKFVEWGNLKMVERLYRPSEVTDYKFGGLVLKASKGNLETMKYLTRDRRIGNDFGRLSIIYAIQGKNMEMVKYIQTIYEGLARNTEVFGYACGRGTIKIIQYLLSQGADVCMGNNIGIWFATKENNLEVVKYLHSLGADFTDDGDVRRGRAVDIAVKIGRLEVLKYFHENGLDINSIGEQSMQIACVFGHIEILEYIRSFGVTLNLTDELVRNVFLSGEIASLEYIHSLGANINIDMYADCVGFCYCIVGDHMKKIEYIISCGFDTDKINEHALMCVIKNNRIEVAEYFNKVLGVRISAGNYETLRAKFDESKPVQDSYLYLTDNKESLVELD